MNRTRVLIFLVILVVVYFLYFKKPPINEDVQFISFTEDTNGNKKLKRKMYQVLHLYKKLIHL